MEKLPQNYAYENLMGVHKSKNKPGEKDLVR